MTLLVKKRARKSTNSHAVTICTAKQGGITCGAIDEPRKSAKAIDERVIINVRNKNVVIARFRDKNVVIARFRDKNDVIARLRAKNDDCKSRQMQFRDKTAYVWGLRYR